MGRTPFEPGLEEGDDDVVVVGFVGAAVVVVVGGAGVVRGRFGDLSRGAEEAGVERD